MSNRVEDGGLFVNTGFLRDHVSKLRSEKKIVLELRENVEAIKNLCDPEYYYKINAILRDIDQMLEYFEKMAASMENIGEEATRLSRTIGQVIEDDTDRANNAVSNAFTL